MSWGATIAQWIRLSLPTCCPRFESQAHHLRFYQFKFQFKLWHVEKTKISRKRGRDWPIFKKKCLWHRLFVSAERWAGRNGLMHYWLLLHIEERLFLRISEFLFWAVAGVTEVHISDRWFSWPKAPHVPVTSKGRIGTNKFTAAA